MDMKNVPATPHLSIKFELISLSSWPGTATVLSKSAMTLKRCNCSAEFLDSQQIYLLLYIFYAAVSLCRSHIKSITNSYFHLQVLNFKDLPQVKSLVCLHMEKLAVCWHQCQSTRRGMTRLKHSGNQPAPLADFSETQLDSEQERLQAHSVDPLCCLITAAHCMRYQCFSPPHFVFLQVKLKKGLMKYLKYSNWGLQRSDFFFLSEGAGARWP